MAWALTVIGDAIEALTPLVNMLTPVMIAWIIFTTIVFVIRW